MKLHFLIQYIYLFERFVERDSSRVSSSRWYDIQTKARSEELKERERTKKADSYSADMKEEKRKNNTKIIYSSPTKQAFASTP